MTKEEIMNMPAGRELDRVIAKKIFGYETQENGNWCKDNGKITELLNCSTDMNDAMGIARKFIPNFILTYLPDDNIGGAGWHCNINGYYANKSKTPTLAICRAALLATLGVE